MVDDFFHKNPRDVAREIFVRMEEKDLDISTWWNGGATHHPILNKKCPHFWNYMDIILHPLHHP
jgi:hypothetical protein